MGDFSVKKGLVCGAIERSAASSEREKNGMVRLGTTPQRKLTEIPERRIGKVLGDEVCHIEMRAKKRHAKLALSRKQSRILK